MSTRPQQSYDFADARPASELLPWLFLCDDRQTIVCKDSSLLSIFEFKGVDCESGDAEDLEAAARQMDECLRGLTEFGIRYWTRADRVRAEPLPEAQFDNPIAQEIDTEYRASMKDAAWETLYTVALSMPTQRNQRTVASMAREYLDSGVKLPVAMAKAVMGRLRGSPKDRIGFETKEELDNALLRFRQNIVTPFMQSLFRCKLRLLEGEELLGYLEFMASGGIPRELSVNEFSYLDTVGRAWIDNRYRDFLIIEGDRTQYVGVLTLKMAPESDRLASLDVLSALPICMTIVNCWKSMPDSQAIKDLKSARTWDELKQMDFKTLLRGALKGKDALEEDQSAKTEIGQACVEHIKTIKAGFAGWGHLATTILVWADDPATLERHMERVTQQLARSRLSFLREREGALAGFGATVMGNVQDPLRWFTCEASNVTDLSPIITLGTGSPIHPLYSLLADETGVPIPRPPVFTGVTRYGTYAHTSYHPDDGVGNGNTLYVGPSGNGKTIQKLFMTAMSFKYPHFRSIIFDKDFSCQAATLLLGGDWVNLSPMESGDSSDMPKMNPLAWLSKPGGKAWVLGWLDRLMSSRGERLTDEQLGQLGNALSKIENLAQSGAPVRLTSLMTQVQDQDIRARLQIWCQGGTYGHYFDNDLDELTFATVTCFEVGGLIATQMTDVLRAFTDYVFFRVEQLITSVEANGIVGPTEIYFEEAGVLLEDPVFETRAIDYLMTIRKKRGHLVMTAQSPETFVRSSKLRMAVRENVATVVFLPNTKATTKELGQMYREAFGLNDNHLELIRDAKPMREYCVWHQQVRQFRIVNVRLPKGAVARLMSNKSTQQILAETYDPLDVGWRDVYLNRVMKEVLS